jgi:beta-glucosidase
LHAKNFVTVTFLVRNTGKIAGTEIAQLYISPPASAKSPPALLKGFEAIPLAPDQSHLVTMSLSRYDFSIWDVPQQKWVIPKGKTGIFIGASSRDKRLIGSVNL